MLRHAVMKGAFWRGRLPRETLSVSPIVAELMHVPFSVWMFSPSKWDFLICLIQRDATFPPFFSACSYLYLTQSTFLSVLTWPARNMSDGSNSMAETKPEEYHPHSLNLTFVRISPPRAPSLSPTCRFIVEVEECHFCSENIGRWTGVITAPLNHLTLAVMGLQEGE